MSIRDGMLFSTFSESRRSHTGNYSSINRKKLSATAHFMPDYLTGMDPETGQGEHPVVHFTVGAQAFEVEIDLRSGQN